MLYYNITNDKPVRRKTKITTRLLYTERWRQLAQYLNSLQEGDSELPCHLLSIKWDEVVCLKQKTLTERAIKFNGHIFHQLVLTVHSFGQKQRTFQLVCYTWCHWEEQIQFPDLLQATWNKLYNLTRIKNWSYYTCPIIKTKEDNFQFKEARRSHLIDWLAVSS